MSHHIKVPTGPSRYILLLLAVPIMLTASLQLGKKFSLVKHLLKSARRALEGPENLGIEELPELLDEGDFQVRYLSPVSQEVVNVRVFDAVVEITYISYWAHGQGHVEIVTIAHKEKTGMHFTLTQNVMTKFCRRGGFGNRDLWDHDARALGTFMLSLRALVGAVQPKF